MDKVKIALWILTGIFIIAIVCLILIAKNVEVLSQDPCRICVEQRGWTCFTGKELNVL